MNVEDLINNFNFTHLKFKIWSSDVKIPNCIYLHRYDDTALWWPWIETGHFWKISDERDTLKALYEAEKIIAKYEVETL